MTIFFTSDSHFGHQRILSLCDRPFKDVKHMNEVLVHKWNSVVSHEDTVYHLGDVALGPIEDSLVYVSRLNGRKVLVVGNHDRPFPPMQKGREDKVAVWTQRYLDAGFDEIYTEHSIVYNRMIFNLSHFPYDGDSHDEDRFQEFRLTDDGTPLIHGHTHSGSTYSVSKAGTPQIHVGVDAWDFAPVSMAQVLATMAGTA